VLHCKQSLSLQRSNRSCMLRVDLSYEVWRTTRRNPVHASAVDPMSVASKSRENRRAAKCMTADPVVRHSLSGRSGRQVPINRPTGPNKEETRASVEIGACDVSRRLEAPRSTGQQRTDGRPIPPMRPNRPRSVWNRSGSPQIIVPGLIKGGGASPDPEAIVVACGNPAKHLFDPRWLERARGCVPGPGSVP
jgi:hypothetical protein